MTELILSFEKIEFYIVYSNAIMMHKIKTIPVICKMFISAHKLNARFPNFIPFFYSKNVFSYEINEG